MDRQEAGVSGMRSVRRAGEGGKEGGKKNLRAVHLGGLRAFLNDLLNVTDYRITFF